MAILAVLLFPLYWMLNVSLQPSSGAVATPWLPTDISFHGYAKALHDQGGHLLTSLEIAIGSVIFSLLIAAPAAYALAQFRIRGASVVLLLVLISQMVPNIVVANALYGAYANLGLLELRVGAHPRRLVTRDPVRDAGPARLHAHDPSRR